MEPSSPVQRQEYRRLNGNQKKKKIVSYECWPYEGKRQAPVGTPQVTLAPRA